MHCMTDLEKLLTWCSKEEPHSFVEDGCPELCNWSIHQNSGIFSVKKCYVQILLFDSDSGDRVIVRIR
jgi:hypothetical protein